MNCRNAIEILDRMIFEEVPADAGLRQHIDTCPSCSQAYKDVLKAREVMNLVRRLEPVLRDPDEITDNIMFAIQQDPKKTVVVPLFLQRLLAAADGAVPPSTVGAALTAGATLSVGNLSGNAFFVAVAVAFRLPSRSPGLRFKYAPL